MECLTARETAVQRSISEGQAHSCLSDVKGKAEIELLDRIECGDCLQLISSVADHTLDLIVTSPPYWAKRIYNGTGELGSEETPEEFVEKLANYFEEFKPKLKNTGNLFVNIGDTFFGSGAGAWNKYLDENGEVTQVQKERKEKY
ncbi:MAG: site-specific DNA-methyltransferase, partial [Clostridiales bacterium]|nr:site-specific DNA-methyltransferase [Clostridiales bacterium]